MCIARRDERDLAVQTEETVLTETERVILRRRSVRLYKKKQVPESMVKRILEAGRFAPSAGNSQPWKFVVVRDEEIIRGLTATVAKITGLFRDLLDYRRPGFSWLRPIANLFIRLKPNDLHPMPFSIRDLVSDGRLGLYHGASTVILIFKDVRGVSEPDLDCGIAGQNMVLAAHSTGLGTCWVGFTKMAFQYTRKWKKFFGIRYPYKFATSIGIGFPQVAAGGIVERQTNATDW